jgi:hypothetical protein
MAPALLVQNVPTLDKERYFDLSKQIKFATRNKPCSKPQTNPEIPLPLVSRLDLNSYSRQEDLAADIIESLRRSGGCIIRNMIQKVVLNSIESEIRPHLNNVRKGEGMYNEHVLIQGVNRNQKIVKNSYHQILVW